MQLLTRRTALTFAAGALAAGGAACAAPPAPAAGPDMTLPEPSLRFAFQANITLDPARELGVIDGMRRRIIPITGGTISGPRLTGKVLPGGADWQGVRPADGLTRLMAHYWIEAADRAPISVQNSGIRRATPEVMSRMLAGEIVAPADYYFRATPVFEAGPGPHQWMNESVFVCVGARMPSDVLIRVYEVV